MPERDSYIVNTEIIQRPSNFNLLGCVEEGVGKLLTLSQSALNDFERADVAKEVRYWLVRIPGIDGGTRLLSLGVDGREFTCGGESLLFSRRGSIEH